MEFYVCKLDLLNMKLFSFLFRYYIPQRKGWKTEDK